MKTRNLVSLVISVLLLAACQPAPPGEPTVPGEEPGEAAPAPATPDALHGTSWQLDSFGPADAAVAPGAAITLEFSAGGQVGGHSGCNNYGGSYTVQESRLHITEIVSTLKACDDEALNDQEGQYLTALRTASRLALAGDGLTIWYGEDEGALRFVPLAAATAPPTGSPPAGKQGERIRFPAEGNSVEIFAELSAGVTDSFVLAAEQGQILSVQITSPHNDVGLAVAGEDGTLFNHPENGPPSWAAERQPPRITPSRPFP
jgi:heat shock protein HslJ